MGRILEPSVVRTKEVNRPCHKLLILLRWADLGPPLFHFYYLNEFKHLNNKLNLIN